jgi:hypothetical protein
VFDVTVTAPAELNLQSATVSVAMLAQNATLYQEFSVPINTPTRLVFRRPAGVALMLVVHEAVNHVGDTLRASDRSSVMFPWKRIESRFPNEGVPHAVELAIRKGKNFTLSLAPTPAVVVSGPAQNEQIDLPHVIVWNPGINGYRPTLVPMGSSRRYPGDISLQCGGTNDCTFTVGACESRPEYLYLSVSTHGTLQIQRFQCSPCPEGDPECTNLGRFDMQPEAAVATVSITSFSALKFALPDAERIQRTYGYSLVRLSDRKIIVLGPERGIRYPQNDCKARLPSGSYVVVPGEFSFSPFHLNLVRAVENGIDLTTYGLPSITVSADTPNMELSYNLDDLYAAAKTVPQQAVVPGQ